MRGPALVIVVICALAARSGATTASEPPEGVRPIPVSVGLYVVGISNLDEVAGTFVAKLDVVARWTDRRLAFDADSAGTKTLVYTSPVAEEVRRSIWNAQIIAINGAEDVKVGRSKLTIHSTGLVEVRARLTQSLEAPLNFHGFPFDNQVLPIQLESFVWHADIVQLRALPDVSGFAPEFRMPEWEVLGVRTALARSHRSIDGVPFSRLTFNVEIRRQSGYYVWKVILPLIIIVMISWVVFWMHEERLGRRAAVSATGILTTIAYQFIVSESLPRVPYLTAMDRIIVLSLVTIGATMVVNVAVERVGLHNTTAAKAIDVICRFAFPLGFFGAFLVLVLQ